MYRILFVGLFLLLFTAPYPAVVMGQPVSVKTSGAGPGGPKYVVGLGEYQCFVLVSATGKLYGISDNMTLLGVGDNSGIPGLPVAVNVPDSVVFRDVASGLHNSLAVDQSGGVWTWGANNSGESGTGQTGDNYITRPVKIGTDSVGAPFSHVVQVACWANNYSNGNLAVKSDGTVWIWGNTAGGMRGNGQAGQVNTRPVKVDIPRRIKKVVACEVVIALAEDGSVWTWGGNNRHELLGVNTGDYMRPHRVILPQGAKDIAGGGFFSYALGVNGTLYGWGYYSSYMGIGNGGYQVSNFAVPVPRDLTADLKLPARIASVTTNSVSTHVILTDGTLWGWGDNACGAVGDGAELDYARHNPPYLWDWGPGQLLVQRPAHIAKDIRSFTHVFGGSGAVFYSYAETSSGQLYSWGRNKTGVLGNGVIGATSEIVAKYPNSWDVPLVTAVDPFSLHVNKVLTSPYCLLHPDESPCNQYRAGR